MQTDVSTWQLKRTHAANTDFKNLIMALDDELSGRYGKEQAKFDVHNVLSPEVYVIVAYANGRPLGCGCFRPMNEPIFTAEVKRMYVVPEQRNKGVAKMILNALEVWAKEQGYKSFLLETGVKQPEAIAAYENSGYIRIENYGPYKNSAYSVCMKKALT